MKQRTRCTIDGCEKKHCGRGYCRMHLERLNRHGDPLYKRTRQKDLPCTVEGCDRPIRARGLCSTHCYRMKKYGSLELPTTEQRFWDKVDKSGDCWEWTAYKTKDGYGVFNFSGRSTLAHRAAWELCNEEAPPADLEVDHTCRNRACVNPDHLRLATDAENQQNLATYGRNGRSGVRGVYWHAANKKWVAQVQAFGIKHYLGQFLTLEEAAQAAKAKRLEIQTFNYEDRRGDVSRLDARPRGSTRRSRAA